MKPALPFRSPRLLLHPGRAVLTLALCTAALGAETVEDRIDRSFEVKAGSKLVVHADRGSVEVSAQETNRVVILVTRRATGKDKAAARELLAQHAVEMKGTAEEVTVKGEAPSKFGRGWGRERELRVEYRIIVPRASSAELHTAGGSIHATGLQGGLEARTAGGSIVAREIKGTVSCRTAGGSIEAAGIEGGLEAVTAGGSIHASSVNGPVTARTSGGSISLKRCAGAMTLSTAGGSISGEDVEGAIEAGTSGGNIDISFTAAPQAASSLKTSGGGIEVKLPAGANLDLDARAEGGRVRSDFSVPSPKPERGSRNSLSGKIGEGGAVLKLRSSGGGVSILKRG